MDMLVIVLPLALRPQDNYAGGMVIFGGGALVGASLVHVC